MPNGLSFQQAGLSTGGVPLLGAFDLHLPCGVLTLLTGPNGAGKSSLLRWVANQVLPDLGNRLPDSTVTDRYLFAGEFGLRAELDVIDQVLYFADLYQPWGTETTEAGRRQTVQSILNRLGLLDWADEKVGSLSSGQKVRLGLSGLLLSQCRLWLLDEPLNALDSQSVALLASEISAHLNAGGLVFMASHADVGLLTHHEASIRIQRYHIQSGHLVLQESTPAGGYGQVTPVAPVTYAEGHQSSALFKSFRMLIQREWNLVLGNPQSILWSALFHWMILTFFGLSLIKSDLNASRGAIWVSSILAVLLVAKDWFTDDQRCGWVGLLTQVDKSSNRSGILSSYWVSKVLLSIVVQIASVLPVALLAAIQFGLNVQQLFDLSLSLSLGLAAAAPLLALISLMVLMTRGGAVLVYVLALPMLVPVMVFGLEGSQAQELGRSTLAPWFVLGSMAGLGLLLGPWIGRRLMILIQE